jgi:hypothetical protein
LPFFNEFLFNCQSHRPRWDIYNPCGFKITIQTCNDFVDPAKTDEAKKRLEAKRAIDRKSYQKNIKKRQAYDRERYARKKALPK